MRFAVDIAPFGDLADPRWIATIAHAAEQAGWDGLSIWDHTGASMGTVAPDPFIALAAAATATDRLRLITSVVVLPRRRPHLVAQSAATLDRLSGGRLVLGVGSGADPGDFTRFGDDAEYARRLDLLDEGLPLVDRLLRGERVRHEGAAYRIDGVTVGPRPIQEPRPPIWFGCGTRPGALRRAALWDGWIAVSIADDGASVALPPGGFAEAVARLRSERDTTGRATDPFDVAVFGQAGLDGSDPRAYASAGATWWLESMSGWRGSPDELLALVERGPAAFAGGVTVDPPEGERR